ncbi:hypothetical protein BU26DRAFT_72090 [Trematosphaeria pertusa]|uniref:Uncharacterized protein n=1 Tax=Trematosphaeria pertusa TaxID=390896 RepID=A0A6A6I506_9PLEO|nr:uncharacterized protein BU26DRAFT_72090 [Trematosphaeria pertusa]KAF2245624.1 hypothetical protein BU26DRAFT_72090 [Trematosphaeria pertusa]
MQIAACGGCTPQPASQKQQASPFRRQGPARRIRGRDRGALDTGSGSRTACCRCSQKRKGGWRRAGYRGPQDRSPVDLRLPSASRTHPEPMVPSGLPALHLPASLLHEQRAPPISRDRKGQSVASAFIDSVRRRAFAR